MITFENVQTYADAHERYTRDRYGWNGNRHTKDSDQLLMFTTEIHAQRESRQNFEHFCEMARAHDMRYLIVDRCKIQFLGIGDIELIRHVANREPWVKAYKQERDHGSSITTESTNLGGVVHIRAYNHGLMLKEQYGVHDLWENRRIKNREDIIRRFWDYGFATWRGRPPTVAQLKWTGPRDHLEHLSKLTDMYWQDQYGGRSEVARKIASAYRSINRYAAWPGAW